MAQPASRHRWCAGHGDGARDPQEFYVERQVPRFVDYVKKYSDLPFLITVKEKDGAYVPDKFLTSADLGDDSEGSAFKTVLVDSASGRPVVPNGSLGFRYSESGKGKWNLDLEGIDPALSLHNAGGSHNVEVLLPRFDVGQEDSEGGGVHPAASRSCPSTRPAVSGW